MENFATRPITKMWRIKLDTTAVRGKAIGESKTSSLKMLTFIATASIKHTQQPKQKSQLTSLRISENLLVNGSTRGVDCIAHMKMRLVRKNTASAATTDT